MFRTLNKVRFTNKNTHANLRRIPCAWRCATLLLLFIGILPACVQAQSRGFVRKLSGAATRKSGGALAKRDQLQSGDMISVAKGGSCTIALRANGAQYEIPGGCTVLINATSIKKVSGPNFKTLEPVDTGAWEDSMMSLPRLLGHLERAADDESTPYNLSPNSAILTSDVKLKWKCALPETEGISFRLTLQDDSEHEVLRINGIDAKTRQYALPNDAMQPGLWYVWSVEIIGGEHSGSKCSRMIRILPEAERQTLKTLESQAAKAHNAEPPSHKYDLALARQYKWSGFPEQAMEIYKSLLSSNPADISLKKEVDMFSKSLEIKE